MPSLLGRLLVTPFLLFLLIRLVLAFRCVLFLGFIFFGVRYWMGWVVNGCRHDCNWGIGDSAGFGVAKNFFIVSLGTADGEIPHRELELLFEFTHHSCSTSLSGIIPIIIPLWNNYNHNHSRI